MALAEASRGGGSERRTPSSRLSLFADRHFRWLIIWPSILIILLIGLFPIIYSLVVSFMRFTRRGEDTSWQGFDNYGRLLGDDRFWESLLHTGIFTAVALPLELLLGLALARLFLEKMPGRQALISILILPTAIAPFVAGAMWRLMWDNIFGPINQILSWFYGESVDILWLVNDNPFIVYSAILVCEIWQWTPFMFLVLLAAMSNVDKSQLEAAELDGASALKVFRRIILPAIKPVIIVALTIRGLELVRLFDIVWALTHGGPGNMTETLSVYAYVKGFERFDTSVTAAMTFLVIIALSLLVMMLLKRVAIAR